jgi:hypothetical protein
MKSILLAVGAALTVCACTSTTAPQTAWGKEGVSMLDYRTDGGQCAVLAATAPAEGNGANSAGGIDGVSPTRLPDSGGAGRSSSSTAAGGAPAPSGPSPTAFPTGGGGAYRDNTNVDMVSRAATQQQAMEVAAQKQRTERLKSCLVDRGYTEFSLTPEQRAHLATLPQGSDERREYLYKLGTDPDVLKSQKAAKKSGS